MKGPRWKLKRSVPRIGGVGGSGAGRRLMTFTILIRSSAVVGIYRLLQTEYVMCGLSINGAILPFMYIAHIIFSRSDSKAVKHKARNSEMYCREQETAREKWENS